MFRRGNPLPTDADSLRAAMHTNATPWTRAGLRAELVFYAEREGRRPRPVVLLTAGAHTAFMPLAELTELAAGTASTAESVYGRDEDYFVSAVEGIAPDSGAGEVIGGLAPDRVAFLAAHARAPMELLGDVSREDVANLVTWALDAEVAERAARTTVG